MKHFFEGWYYKHQNETETVAFIPGYTKDSAFIQVVTNEKAYFFQYKLSECRRRGNIIRIGESLFSPRGISIHIHRDGYDMEGDIRYDSLHPIKHDIMGPFRFFPMQCRHGIISMSHRLHGTILLNNREICFDRGTGYIETDSGCSFPKSYAWIQSNDLEEPTSVMAAIADIPFAGVHFRGFICIVMHKGKEYRLATYNGARIIHCSKNKIIVQRGKYRLKVNITNHEGHRLCAPQLGQMSRMIKESPSCHAQFHFSMNETVIFDEKSDKTSYEFVKVNSHLF